MIQFDLPKEQSSILKVIGIGGGGSNAVNHMFSQNIDGVNFIICNTDAQALAISAVPNKIQLGPQLTQGLGAGANPQIGREATQESLEEIKRILEVNTKMAFITAGMGGGTGTGGAPIVAKICKDLGILTVGIVTTPFGYEGKKRKLQAEEGINKLKDHVDTLLVISNDKLRHQFGNLTMKAAFNKADNVLATAAKCITDVINSTGQINVDFADVCTVMRNGGVAILGNAEAQGENRAQRAIEQALNSPLLNDNDIKGAKWILININSSEGDHEFTMDEVEIIQSYLWSQAGENSDVILGLGYDNTLEDKIGITLIATGFEHPEEPEAEVQQTAQRTDDKIVVELKPQEQKQQQPLFVFEKEEEEEEAPMPPAETGIRSITDKDIASSLSASEDQSTLAPKMVQGPVQSPVNIPGIYFEKPAPKPAEAPIEKKNFVQLQWDMDANDLDGNTQPEPMQRPTEPQPMQRPVQPDRWENREKRPEDMRVVQKPVAKEPADEGVRNHDNESGDGDDLRKRAMERIEKLRKLSFNTNAGDPHNEYENVPAYLRRGMELNNSIANVESFYANYTVKNDEENKVKIGTINSYLDGKKPD